MWPKASKETIAEFPRLTFDELRKFTLGPYQLDMGDLYNQQHEAEDGDYEIKVHRQEAGLLRARMPSRFSKHKFHDIWIRYTDKEIVSYYCTCKVGARTVGSCSHTSAVC